MDIVLLIFLAWRMGKLAELKGLSKVRWRWYTVLAWIGGEFIGIIIGLMIWGQDNLMMLELIGIGFAAGAYFTVRDRLLKKDDYHPSDFDYDKEQKDTNNPQ